MEYIEFLNSVKQQVIIAILADDELGDRLVLKGGNLLQFAYELSARASKDIDISVDGDFDDFDWLQNRVRTGLNRTFGERDLVVFDFEFREVPAQMSEDLKSFWGGYQCRFKLIPKDAYDANIGSPESIRRKAYPLDSQNRSTIFKVDFSRHEFCGDKEEFEISGYRIFGYSPRMFVAEKLRAICQQMPQYGVVIHRTRATASRARDFVDIYVIASHYGIAFDDLGFQQTVAKTFEIKKVPLEWIGRIGDFRDHHEPDFASVRDTVQPEFHLQDFDYYFDFVCKKCEALKPLWDK
jgi:hypothetical protein